MKPAPFDYFDPETIEDVLDLLQQYGDDAKIMAGGQSLGPLLNMRMSLPEVIVDINRVSALDYQYETADHLILGAQTRQYVLEDDPTLAERQPILMAALPHIGHRSIRTRSTVGGSLAHADPAAEWPAIAALLDAEMVIQQANQPTQVLGPDEFFQSALITALEPEALLVEVRLPHWPTGAGWSFVEFSRRHGDFALLGAAASLQLDANRRCTEARLVLIGAAPIPIRPRQTEAYLTGEIITEALITSAAQEVRQEIEPDGDLHGSADYRRHLATVLVSRALTEAAQRAIPGGAV
ncbi:MAG: xanthine dehydrogenase family protein subunit M [Chloroflexota bacterium]